MVMRSLTHVRKQFLAFALLAALTTASASPSVGVTLLPFTGGWPDLSVTASVPFATYETFEGPVEFAARLDVITALNFSERPAVGLTATGIFVSHDMLQPYFGAGAVLGWDAPAAGGSLYVTPTVLAGLRVPLNPTWAARFEGTVAPLRRAFTLGVGIELSL